MLLTDQEGLFDADPRFNPQASLINKTRVDNPQLDVVAGGSASGLGLGGMVTKVRAARLAARSGAGTIIASGRQLQVLDGICRGEVVVCLDVAGNEIARGLFNYDAQETSRLMGKSSSQIEQTLGYVDEEELIHRDNLVLL